jgi:hypothetical protein
MADSLFPGLAAEVRELLRGAIVAEFATVSAAGIPIDTPTFCFFNGEDGSLDVATGVAYPAKAERARRNAKVGLLIEGGPEEPVVAIAAVASVRDADIQANLDRYIAETIAYYHSYSGGQPWRVARQSTWYWARVFVRCKPRTILWWPTPAHIDEAPQRWAAPPEVRYPPSDPAPRAPTTAAPDWGTRPWSECAAQALTMRGHLTVLDAEGFPMPFPVRSVTLRPDGFDLAVPAGVPWQLAGKASLCFLGTFTFVGTVKASGNDVRFTVERMLPTLPTVSDSRELWQPSDATRSAFQTRLERELQRRGQPIPQVPIEPPSPTPGSVFRAARMARLVADGAARPQHD